MRVGQSIQISYFYLDVSSILVASEVKTKFGIVDYIEPHLKLEPL